MAQVQKQLVASQKFLSGLRSLPHCPELRNKQLGAILKATETAQPWSTDQGATRLSVLEPELWEGEAATKLQTAFASKTLARTLPRPLAARCKTIAL